MSEWQPLSVRRGLRGSDGPFEGVPSHLKAFLAKWLKEAVDEAGTSVYRTENYTADAIAMRLRIPTHGDFSTLQYIAQACSQDEDLFLDAVDVALLLTHGRQAEPLEGLLFVAGSAWKVQEDGQGLVRRVPDSEAKAHAAATEPDDEITAELDEAWAKTYGRHPDASDAWDHAIKAVEMALWPLVTPDKPKATLGTIIDRLGKQDAPFGFRLATSSTTTTSVEALVQMLRLMWPNPDRHGTGHRRTPEPEEAVNVVQLAITVVGWVRTGALVRSPAA